jgi:hypothetical protein
VRVTGTINQIVPPDVAARGSEYVVATERVRVSDPGSRGELVAFAAGYARLTAAVSTPGWDLFGGPHYTRFSSFGVGDTPDRLRYIQLACTIAGHC